MSISSKTITDFNPRSLTGATAQPCSTLRKFAHFNPRSLTGATLEDGVLRKTPLFQSTLPYGSDTISTNLRSILCISIHAPLRERRTRKLANTRSIWAFQSTLPYGSDSIWMIFSKEVYYFNPRSLTGATFDTLKGYGVCAISIHAPLRERRNCQDSTSGA